MAVSDRYATFANFGGGYKDQASRPQIKKVVIAECIKRRLPTKHYVYKMVVEWSSGTTSIVYRRYSMFFDFQVKLQELYTTVCECHPQFLEKVPHLPELPGKILFGRSHIHQVAEKRRGKIEEFCQQVVSLPQEISRTNLVMGFFNTWPEDTMLPMHSESVSSTPSHSSSFTSSCLSPTQVPSPGSPTNRTPSPRPFSPPSATSATEAVISHPDEMENLEQYSVLADYRRKDSHQVNLCEGQVVHVIEKHDTGWWMVMSDDEQGYAPAAYLEPVEGGVKQVVEQAMDSSETCEEYEAMESYTAQSADEVDFTAGDKIEVINKSLDGWWKIRCNNKVGLVPSALIRKIMEAPQLPRDDVIYESHKSIYQGLNIHKPPPRRNTIERNCNHVKFQQEVYAVPRPYPPLLKHATDPMLHFDDTDHDYVEPPIELTSEDEEDTGYYRVPRSLQGSDMSRLNGILSSPPPKSSEDSVQRNNSGSADVQQDTTHAQEKAGADVAGGIYDMVPGESPYETEPSDPPPSSGSAGGEPLNNITARADTSSPVSPISITTSPPPQTHTPSSSTTDHREGKRIDDDYVDIDQHDEYVDPGELRAGADGASDTAPPPSPSSSYDLFKPLPKPPLPTSDPPKKKPKMGKSKSLSIELSESMEEDEYVPMDPIYSEPPPEEPDEPNTPNLSTAQQQKQHRQFKTPTPSVSPALFFSPSPVSQGKHKKLYPKLKLAARAKVHISSPILVEMNGGLTKAKSVEDLLASSSSRETSPQRLGSPQSERKVGPAGRVPVLPPVSVGGSSPGSSSSKGKGAVDQVSGDSKGVGKSKMKIKTGKLRKGMSDTQVNQHVTRSSSPQSSVSPEHRSVTHTTSVPTHPLPSLGGHLAKERSVHLKTYVAKSNYQSQVTNSLNFQAGDKCVLLRKTQDGWWLVNIGGREGWTPEAYWKEESRDQTSTIARPPGPAPTVSPLVPPERKPRSHTVATDGVGFSCGLELSSSMEASLEDSTSGQSSWGGSVEVDRQLTGDTPSATVEGRKPTPPTPPPQSTKPNRRDPPVPKPKSAVPSNNPMRKKGDRKPPVPYKPVNIPSVPPKVVPPSSSPPLSRRANVDTSSPPPPPPPTNQKRPDNSPSSDGEYAMLEHTSTLNPLESSPWFVGKMERVGAEQFLMEHGRQREFLVRERAAKDGYYALSIRYHYSCKHFNIDPTSQGQYMIGNLTFPAISDIVHHYQNNSLFIHENQHVTLSLPARRRTRGSVDNRIHA